MRPWAPAFRRARATEQAGLLVPTIDRMRPPRPISNGETATREFCKNAHRHVCVRVCAHVCVSVRHGRGHRPGGTPGVHVDKIWDFRFRLYMSAIAYQHRSVHILIL